MASSYDYYSFACWNINSVCRRKFNFSIYLYNILMDRQEVYKTTNVLILAALVGFLLTDYFFFMWFSVGLLLSNLFYFRLSRVISIIWLRFSKILGVINSNILLTIVFFLFLTPLGVLFRHYNTVSNHHFKRNVKGSYFDKVTVKYSKSYFLRQF